MFNKSNSQLRLFWVVLFIVALSSTLFAVDCGDVNGDGSMNILDITHLISYLYKQGPAPVDPQMADVNSSGNIDLLDITYIISFLYKDGDMPNCIQYQHIENSGSCNAFKGTDDDTSFAVFEVLGNDLRITHMNAYYNCCLEYYVDYEFEGLTIIAYEYDINAPCDCNCPFNLQTTLLNLIAGEYDVCIIGIDGDTIGCETVTIEGDSGLSEYNSGPCVMMEPDKSDTYISYSLTGETLSFTHNDAFFNCGAYFMIQFDQAGDTLRFYELNISPIGMYCMCYFDIGAAVTGISPGDYVAEVWQMDIGEPELTLFDRRNILLQ